MFDRINTEIERLAFKQPDSSATIANYMLAQQGIVPSARLVLSADASNNDTIAIGGKTFKFVTTLGAAAAQVQVKRGTSAASTRAALVKAINGTTDSTLWVEATTPFALLIVADQVGTSVRIRKATARGGLPLAGTVGSTVLAEAITAAADIWNCADLSASGKSPADYQCAAGSFTVDATMVTNGSYQLELPFTPTVFIAYATSSAGVLRSINEAVTISSNALSFVMAGGASPNIQATDVITVMAFA